MGCTETGALNLPGFEMDGVVKKERVIHYHEENTKKIGCIDEKWM